MAGAVWDMHTSGPLAGQVKQPLAYTTTEEGSIRVQVYLDLATEFGEWALNETRGLAARRMIDPEASDEERAALVRDVILFVDEAPRPGVVAADPVDVETDIEAEGGPRVTVTAACQLSSGETVTLGPFVVG